MTTLLSPQDLGLVPIADAPLRARVRVRGRVMRRGAEDRCGCPAAYAELSDGTATVRLEFLGRRAVAGLQEGVELDADGTIARVDGQLRILNPLIELHAGR
jgi:hypothetical protein